MRNVFFIFAISLFITSCKKENKAPTANAGIDQTINEGATVTLDGSASADPDGNVLTYLWTVPSGITLSSQTEAKPTFIAPEVSTETNYTFSLVVNDGKVSSPADEVVITVVNVDKFLTFIKAGQTDGPGIKYVDFEPDAKFAYGNDSYTEFLNLDLNNDSIDDFELKYYSFHFETYLQIIPKGNNSVCFSKTLSVPDYAFVESLANGDTIGINNNWINSKAFLFTYYLSCYTDYDTGNRICSDSFSGYWYDHDHIYMGVKIIKNNKEFFGWIDMKGTTVRRYAITKLY